MWISNKCSLDAVMWNVFMDEENFQGRRAWRGVVGPPQGWRWELAGYPWRMQYNDRRICFGCRSAWFWNVGAPFALLAQEVGSAKFIFWRGHWQGAHPLGSKMERGAEVWSRLLQPEMDRFIVMVNKSGWRRSGGRWEKVVGGSLIGKVGSTRLRWWLESAFKQ